MKLVQLQAVPARVALGVTTLLAMSTTMGSIQKSLPPVAYTKVKEYKLYVRVINLPSSHFGQQDSEELATHRLHQGEA
jgi:hypothetical protein